jgi:integrase/recombinase XerC
MLDYIDFRNYLQYEKRFSSHTITAYLTDLEQCNNFTEQHFGKSINNAGFSDIRAWLANLMALKISSKTVNRKISSLKTYYRFLESKGQLLSNPMEKVTSPKTSKRLAVFVSDTSMENLLQEITFADDFGGVRDRLIMEMFYCTGMRLSELMDLKIPDFDIKSRQIRVKGKGNKERIIPVVDALLYSYEKYCSIRAATFGQIDNDFIFLTNKGKKVYRKFVYRLVNFYLSTNTTVSKRSPHILRHSFATHMLNNGADINAIKELLGHSSLSATEVYTHNTVEKIKSVYKQAHPKA